MILAPLPSQPLGCVLAGGHSSRMGRDKAMLLLQGQTLLQHALHQLRAAGCWTCIAGSRPDLEAYAPVIPDLHPGCGPLSGIEAALAFAAAQSAASTHQVLFVPVDLPLVPVRLLALLLERAERTGALATIPFLNGQPQPLCAVYDQALLPAISAAIAAGEYKVTRLLASLAGSPACDSFDVEAVLVARGSFYLAGERERACRWFANMNNPNDFAELERSPVALSSRHG